MARGASPASSKQERQAAFSCLHQLDWRDPVVHHGLSHPIKYVRLVRRFASSPQAKGADPLCSRYSVQLIQEGVPHQKPKHRAGGDVLGPDIGPATLAIFPRQGAAHLNCCARNVRMKRRLESIMHRQRRASNPQHYDAMGRVKKHGKKRFGKSIGLRAPGMLIGQLRRTIAKTGGTLTEVPASQTRLSQSPMTNGKVRDYACEPRWSNSNNVRMRGSHSPTALVLPAPERVGSKALGTSDKSL